MTRAQLIFDLSQKGRRGCSVPEVPAADMPAQWRRRTPPHLPEVSELEALRHYTRLSQKNFSIDTQFYPLGSCTMKYNPRAAHSAASMEGFASAHPLAPELANQGLLTCLFELQEMLCAITGMEEASLAPMAGAQGEFAGVAMIRAYHRAHAQDHRREILVPDASHGTNPATAAMCGCIVKEIPTLQDGALDLAALRTTVGPNTAGLMLTNPSTLGLFEQHILEIQDIVHNAGGLTYYDGANLNALVGLVRPADMGFDVLHMNLHKTFATPHGGGGPGAGAIAANATLAPFLPVPFLTRNAAGYRWSEDRPLSIGRLSTFIGNTGVLLRAWLYLRMLGATGVREVARYAVLNANYLLARLKEIGYQPAYPSRLASHEFVLTLKALKAHQVRALDVAKALLDRGFYAPTVYFPLLVPECLLIEPTETESRQTLDAFATALEEILHLAQHSPEALHRAPEKLPVGRLDETLAAREPDLRWRATGAA